MLEADMTKKILTEDQIIKQFQEWLTDCDADELAKVTGELFGGVCNWLEDPKNPKNYEFYPYPSEYMGAFDKVKE